MCLKALTVVVLCLFAYSCTTSLCNVWTVAYQAPLSMEFSRQEYWFRDSSRPGDQTCISWAFFIGRQILHTSETSLWKASPTERQWEGVSIWTPEVSLPSSPLLCPSCLPPKEKQTSVSPTGPLENWHFFFLSFYFILEYSWLIIC